MADAGLYTLAIKGQKHTYALRGSEHHSLDALASTIADITGYKKDFLLRDRNVGLRNMSINEERVMRSHKMLAGGCPTFVVTRVA
jgi:hypothetical protein